MIRNVFNNDIQVKNAIIDVLYHYSVYEMPLKAEEIYTHLPVACAFSVVLVGLVDLEDATIIYGYYSLRRDIKKLVLQRKVTYN
jgi:hypothetical protein